MRYIIFSAAVLLVLILSWFLTTFIHDHADASYTVIITGLILGIMVILGGCELFANAVECLGDRLNLSHATVGSLLAAVGTALPETMVPIIALITGSAEHGEGIAVGAILGAPFMLSTLAMFLLGTTVIIRSFVKGNGAYMRVNLNALKFELSYFVPIMVSLLLVSLLHNKKANLALGIILLIVYAVFFFYSLKHESIEGEEYTDQFHLSIFIGCPVRLYWIVIQLIIGLLFIISGAHLFVSYLTTFSIKSGVSPVVLSLLITPVATELPEKFNSITWTLKGKDTIGLANITGAMVFQATIPMAVGLIFTEWYLTEAELTNVISTILMASILLFYVSVKKRLPGWLLLTGGLFYGYYIFKVFS